MISASISARSEKWLGWIVAAAITLVSISLHLENYHKAGALWRDEVNTVELARETLPSIYSHLQFDSFPILWFAILRGWISWTGLDDDSLRLLGLLVGLGILSAVWIDAWIISRRPPGVSLVLIAMSAPVIRYGDSLRGHGLGLLTGLLMFGAMWRLVEKPSTTRTLVAAALALLAVHSSFYNAVYLLAAALGGMAVGIATRSRQRMIAPLLVGLTCAISMTPYVSTVLSAREWNELVRHDVVLSWFWSKWKDTANLSGPTTWLLWSIVVVVAVASSLITFRDRDRPSVHRELALFCLVTLTSGIICYWAFLETLSYQTEPWYYLTLIGLLATAADPVFARVESSSARILIIVSIAILAAVSVGPIRETVQAPMTNIDGLAKKISAEASPQDLVFVYPWQNGVSFQRYYRGPALWQTVPPLGFHRWHRYDLFQRIVSDQQALDRFLNETREKLSDGGKVWVVAGTSMLGNPHPQPFPLHNPRMPRGEHLWRMRLSALLSQNRTRVAIITPEPGLNGYERLLLDIGKVDRRPSTMPATGPDTRDLLIPVPSSDGKAGPQR